MFLESSICVKGACWHYGIKGITCCNYFLYFIFCCNFNGIFSCMVNFDTSDHWINFLRLVIIVEFLALIVTFFKMLFYLALVDKGTGCVYWQWFLNVAIKPCNAVDYKLYLFCCLHYRLKVNWHLTLIFGLAKKDFFLEGTLPFFPFLCTFQ